MILGQVNLRKFDKNNGMITLSVITLSGFHCIMLQYRYCLPGTGGTQASSLASLNLILVVDLTQASVDVAVADVSSVNPLKFKQHILKWNYE